MKDTYLAFDLQLFADGAGGGDGGAGAGDAATGATGQEAAAPVYELPRARRRGLQAQPQTQAEPAQAAHAQLDEAPEQTEPEPQEPQRRPFDELVKGEYKAEFDARVQEIVQKRLKNSKQAEERLTRYNPAIELLATKYGVDPADPDALTKALESDRSLFEDEALREGVTVEQLMAQKKLEREVSQYRSERQRAEQEARDMDELTGLVQQAEELKQSHPEFDLEAAMSSNPELARMVLKPPRGAGVPLKAAYIALNFDREQIRWAQQTQQQAAQAAQTAQQQTTQAIASGSRRPVENGTRGGAPASTKVGVPTNLTREQIKEYIQRAQRGEQITFQ